jgi:hypothetical protein
MRRGRVVVDEGGRGARKTVQVGRRMEETFSAVAGR